MLDASYLRSLSHCATTPLCPVGEPPPQLFWGEGDRSSGCGLDIDFKEMLFGGITPDAPLLATGLCAKPCALAVPELIAFTVVWDSTCASLLDCMGVADPEGTGRGKML